MDTDDVILQTLSANLQRLVAENKFSMRKLSAITGDPPMTINGAVRGKNMPGGGLLRRLAEALGVSTDDLLAPEKKSRRSA